MDTPEVPSIDEVRALWEAVHPDDKVVLARLLKKQYALFKRGSNIRVTSVQYRIHAISIKYRARVRVSSPQPAILTDRALDGVPSEAPTPTTEGRC